MKNEIEIIKKVRMLCNKALEGTLGLKEFWDLWPEDADAIPFLNQIKEDIEDGVEHLPGTWITKKILYEEWQKMREYFVLYLDSVLLNFDKSADELAKCRVFVLKQKKLTRDDRGYGK
jgi:hypothetical protein